MAREITLDRDTFKALAGETRVQILKELNERRKTQSELATKLALSAPTVNEHILVLKKAGLVEEIDDGHKWKYFSLTSKGRSILNPSEVQIMLVLSVLAVAFVSLLLIVFSQFNAFSFAEQNSLRAPVLGSAANEALKATEAKDLAGAGATQAVCAAQQLPVFEIALLIASALFIGLMLGYLLKKR